MARLAVIDPGHDGHHAELIGFLSSINSISIPSHAQNITPVSFLLHLYNILSLLLSGPFINTEQNGSDV